MNFLIFKDFYNFILNFFEFNLIYFELNSLIYISCVLTWQVMWHTRNIAPPCGNIWTRHVAAIMCIRVCIRVRTCVYVCVCK